MQRPVAAAPAVYDGDLATFKRLDTRLRYKFFNRDDEGVAMARWVQARGAWEIKTEGFAVDYSGPELIAYIAEWTRTGCCVMLWACLLPECNTAEMKALCATVPNVSHGFCEKCGPKYLQDMQAAVRMMNSCRSPLELTR